MRGLMDTVNSKQWTFIESLATELRKHLSTLRKTQLLELAPMGIGMVHTKALVVYETFKMSQQEHSVNLHGLTIRVELET